MDALIELVGPLLGHWRAAIVTAFSLLAAVALSVTFASFTGGYGIALVLLGLGAGMLWDADASRAKSDRAARRPDA